MGNTVIDELAAAHRPGQFDVLEHAIEVFTTSPAVTQLMVRGSLATGTADRLSDLDFVAGVEDRYFPDFVHARDAFMAAEFNAILPGWRDTIVARMGGLGYVYLIERDGGLQQFDLYLVPASRAEQVTRHTAVRLVFARNDAFPACDHGIGAFIDRELSRPLTCTELLIEILVIISMIRKRLSRGQQFIAYAETHLLHTAVKDLIKTALAPTATVYGWYRLPDEIGVTPIGRVCLRELAAMIAGPSIPTLEVLADLVERIIALARRAAPQAVEDLGDALDAYRYYLDLA